MSEPALDPSNARGAAPRWIARALVLGAFVATLWWFGPKAANVLAARFQEASRNSPSVALDRVGFLERPEWMDKPLLLAVAAGLSPWLHDEVPILDDPTLRRLADGLSTVIWVRSATVERVFPDRLKLQIELRRPVLAVRDGDGAPVCLVDRDGVMMPWVDTALPTTFLHREGGPPTMTVAIGKTAPDRRVRAAAAVAVEFRDEIEPKVAGCPTLLEVDATNLGELWLRGPSYPEIRVKLRREDGAGVLFNYDRPVDSSLLRVPSATKAAVLGNILAKHPGLGGLVAGDLRFSRRWADYLQPRAAGVRDPNEPWNTQVVPRGG